MAAFISPSVLRGRSFSSVVICPSWLAVKVARSVLLGRHCRSSQFVYWFVPRCQCECGSQQETAMSVATVELACVAIPLHLSHVSVHRSCSGRSTIVAI